MNVVRIHFTDGKNTEIKIQDRSETLRLADGLNSDPYGTSRLNTSDGNILIVNRNHITHVQISEAP